MATAKPAAPAKPAAQPTKAVAKPAAPAKPAAQPTKAVATQAPPAAQAVAAAEQFSMDQYAGAGTDAMSGADVAIPFLKVLQPLSPELDESDGKYIEEAKQGQLYNSVTGKLYDGKTGLLFVPCYFERKLLRWGARKAGGGFKGEVSEADVARQRDNGELVSFEGRDYYIKDGKVDKDMCDRLADNRLHYGLILDEEDPDQLPSRVLMSLASTQIKKSKLFNAMMRERTIKTGAGTLAIAPTFGYVYRITTVKESNDQGSWYGVSVALDGPVQKKWIFDMGAAFYTSVKGNEVKVDLAGAESGSSSAGGAASSGDDDKF
jgi:hypothetical protein